LPRSRIDDDELPSSDERLPLGVEPRFAPRRLHIEVDTAELLGEGCLAALTRPGQRDCRKSLEVRSNLSPVDARNNDLHYGIQFPNCRPYVVLLEPYFENLGKRIAKTPKLYPLDTGLCSYLPGVRTSEDLVRSPMPGAIFETHVLGQFVRYLANQGRRRDLYFI
jgi:hypothetical protein